MSLVHKFRAARFRQPSSGAEQLTDDVLLPPPLPLIHLPDEPRRARSGALDGRPLHLPVRTHFHPETRCFPPESILIETRLPIEPPSPDDADTAAVERLRVYEYNRPHVFQQSGAAPDTLVFDSLFEGGNLQYADRVLRSDRAHAYELYVHPDLQNSAYRQWFYFDVRNATRGITYHFSLVNLAKSGALFGAGLQPCVYSEIDAAKGWVHAGSQVHYEASTVVLGTNTLHFQYEFCHDHDCVSFACLQPYSYTDLVEYLDALERDPRRSAFVRRTELCQTIAQNPCDLLSITSAPSASGDSLPLDDKKLIVLSARVHPGEPNASWMMKGMLDYLTGASSGAAVLRNHFVFKVVPMLNPDGVINGNTRVNLAGWDLNRKWSNPIEKLFPTVFHLKRLLTQWQLKDRVAIYCDLHGHSINRNIFTYGCCTGKRASKKPAATNDPRVFPMLVARNSDLFSFASCDFKVVKSKLNTARVVVHHELGVVNSYTLEASFCGPDFGARKDTQFSTWDLEEMGRSWCQSLLIYYGLLPLVRELDQRKERDEAQAARQESCSQGGEELSLAMPEDAALLELQGDLLRDCETAISELFASVDLMDDAATAAARDSCDSDLSGAEDAIPPNDAPEDDGGRMAVAAASRKAVANGYASAPEEYSRDKAATKKLKRRQSTRRKKSAASCGSSKPLGKKKSKHRSRRRREEQRPDPEDDGGGGGGGGRDETGTTEMPGDGESGTDNDGSAKRKKKRKKKKPKHARRRQDKTSSSRGHGRGSASEAAAAEEEDDASLAPTHSVLPDVPGSSSSSSRIPKAPSPPTTSDDPHTSRLELPAATASHQPRCLSSRGTRKHSALATEPLELPPLAGAATTSPPDAFRTGGSGRDLAPQKVHRDPPDDDDGDSSSPSGSSDDDSVVSEF